MIKEAASQETIVPSWQPPTGKEMYGCNCSFCGLTHPEVIGGGLWYCPNPLCEPARRFRDSSDCRKITEQLEAFPGPHADPVIEQARHWLEVQLREKLAASSPNKQEPVAEAPSQATRKPKRVIRGPKSHTWCP